MANASLPSRLGWGIQPEGMTSAGMNGKKGDA
jgi:hypothetical protein